MHRSEGLRYRRYRRASVKTRGRGRSKRLCSPRLNHETNNDRHATAQRSHPDSKVGPRPRVLARRSALLLTHGVSNSSNVSSCIRLQMEKKTSSDELVAFRLALTAALAWWTAARRRRGGMESRRPGVSCSLGAAAWGPQPSVTKASHVHTHTQIRTHPAGGHLCGSPTSCQSTRVCEVR